jgi:hypothetical protein
MWLRGYGEVGIVRHWGQSAGLEVHAVGDERQRLVKGDPLIKAVLLAGVPMV